MGRLQVVLQTQVSDDGYLLPYFTMQVVNYSHNAQIDN